MGNCLHRESSMNWGGDYWGSPVPAGELYAKNSSGEKNITNIKQEEEETSLLYEKKDLLMVSSSSTKAASSTEVKIKISKKQLQELLGRVDMKELSLEQVLSQLMNVGNNQSFDHDHHKSWKPNLQSIPE